MRALLLVVIVSSHIWLTQADEHGCHCGGGSTVNPSTVSDNATTDSDATTHSDTTFDPSILDEEDDEEQQPEASDGPSDGPDYRLLSEEYGSEEYPSEKHGRVLTASSTSSNTTEHEDGVIATTAECICPDQVPGVVSSFASTLSFADPSELANFDIEAMKSSLIESQDWGDNEVVATAVFKVKVTYSLPEDEGFTLERCAEVMREIHGVPAANDVACSMGNTTGRRLQDTLDVDVAMSYPDATAASTAATDVAAMTNGALITNLRDAGITVATISQTAPSVDVEIDWVVTGEATVVAPVVDDLIAAVGDDVTVTVFVTEVAVTYTAMPCSVGLESEGCPSGMSPVASPASVGCVAATCDLADADTQQCCVTRATTGSASTNTQAMGSLMVLFPVIWLWL